MLLRHDSPHDRDPDIFHTMASRNAAAVSEADALANDIPTSHPAEANGFSNSNSNNNNSNNLDDIWGDDPSPFPSHHHHSHTHSHPHSTTTTTPLGGGEISDIPRLSQAHTNAGYRDGITLAKARTAQQGFDEGYGLGATVGARAGQLLGVLEGLAAAVGLHSLSFPQVQRAYHEEEARRIEGLLGEARRELSVRGVFDGEFWAADGNWRYEVRGNEAGMGLGEAGVVFADVAEAHPLLRKWSGIVRVEAARYGVDWEVLKGDDAVGSARREEEEEKEREGRMRRERESRPAVRGGREALAW